MARLFGTDGVRGVAGSELDCLMAFNLGRAGSHVLTENTHHPKILVGRDTRISGTMLEMALCAGICSTGATALVVDVMPTPAIAYLTRKYKADAGVMISASHNPMEFNGIKFFDKDGYKLPDEIEDRIESIIEDNCNTVETATGEHVGRIINLQNAQDDYIDYIASLNTVDLTGLDVVTDCANGAASDIAFKLFTKLGVNVISLFDNPNGTNINENCGSTHMNVMRGIVKSTGFDIGLAFDGDADRMLACDENGDIIDGDKIMMICVREMLENNSLAKNTLVVTVMSNLGLTLCANKLGINLEVTAVGDRYVLENMKEYGYNIGGEQSGHVIFLDNNTTGDGMLSAMKLLEALKNKTCKASELASIMEVMPQILVNITVANAKKNEYNKDEEILEYIKMLDNKYDGKGRVLVRASGTEPLVRVMIEGVNTDEITADANALANIIKQRLG